MQGTLVPVPAVVFSVGAHIERILALKKICDFLEPDLRGLADEPAANTGAAPSSGRMGPLPEREFPDNSLLLWKGKGARSG